MSTRAAKIIITTAFDADREAFRVHVQQAVANLVEAGDASGATLDIRLTDDELGPLKGGLQPPLPTRAVIALWDTAADTALSLPLPEGNRLTGAYAVDEVVQKGRTEQPAPGPATPGLKLIAFARRLGHLTHDQYSRHWRDNHGPLAVARQPGFGRYVQNHVVARLTDDSPSWDGIGEIHYAGIDDIISRSYDSAEGERLIWEDVARFLDAGNSPTIATREWLVERAAD